MKLLLLLIAVVVGHVESTYTGRYYSKGCKEFRPELYPLYKNITNMAKNECFEFCSIRGYVIAILHGHACGCYATLNTNLLGETIDRDQCKCPCAGENVVYCGCENTVDVYSLSKVKQPSTFGDIAEYKGCFEDKENNRDLSGSTKLIAAMMPNDCFNYCNTNGYKYAGLQDGKYCYCDNDYGMYAPAKPHSECNCQCDSYTKDYCGCQLRNKIFEIKKRPSIPKLTCNQPKTCGCSDNYQCYTFDNSRFELASACMYDLVSTNCYDLPSNLVPFVIRQKEKKNGLSTHIEYIEFTVLGNTYQLKEKRDKSIVFTKNYLEAPVPFKEEGKGIQVFQTLDSLVLVADFGVNITWNGKGGVKVKLCDAYNGYVCGLCGNADGNKKNDFIDRELKPVDVSSGSDLVRYFNWASNWKSSKQPDSQACKDYQPVEFSLLTVPCTNFDEYKDSNNWCGQINNANSVWSACTDNMDQQTLQDMASACATAACDAPDDITRHQVVCEAYANLEDICKVNDGNWNLDWRNSCGCDVSCPANREYGRRLGCPNTCEDPDGESCGSPQWTEGCFCNAGYVLDSKQECVMLEECGCVLPFTTTMRLAVNASIANPDCLTKYTCLESNTPPIEEYFNNFCSSNSYCVMENGNPICKCNEGYTQMGAGGMCIAQKHTCQSEFCYGMGDPHYRSIYAKQFQINNTCSYVLATDAIAFTLPSFGIIVDQYQGDNGRWYMERIRFFIMFMGNLLPFSVDEQLWVGTTVMPLPYTSSILNVYREDNYIVVDDPKFMIYFDAVNSLLKVRVCSSWYYGLCSLYNNNAFVYPFSHFISADSVC